MRHLGLYKDMGLRWAYGALNGSDVTSLTHTYTNIHVME